MIRFLLRWWKQILAGIIVIDALVLAGVYYVLVVTDTFAGPPVAAITPTNTLTITPTPWAGPPTPRPLTPTPTVEPTLRPTEILAASGFPHGFTPTPRPTEEPVYIKLPELFFFGAGRVEAPSINQVLYPEPFFAPGTNNACGPIALYAGLLGMGLTVDYSRLRDVAVSYGFNAEGITTSGLANTASFLSQELGTPYSVEYGYRYNTRDLLKQLRQGAMVIVLLRVQRGADGLFRVTPDTSNSFGHFLIVERISTRSKTVNFAGSTLGMEKVGLGDFVASWTGNAQAISPPAGWNAYLDGEPSGYWAMVLKPAR